MTRIWQDALCYFGEDKEVRVGRQYGRVCRRRLRKHLLQRCRDHGVQFLAGMMHELETEQASHTAIIHLADGQKVKSRSAVPMTCGCSLKAGKLDGKLSTMLVLSLATSVSQQA